MWPSTYRTCNPSCSTSSNSRNKFRRHLLQEGDTCSISISYSLWQSSECILFLFRGGDESAAALIQGEVLLQGSHQPEGLLPRHPQGIEDDDECSLTHSLTHSACLSAYLGLSVYYPRKVGHRRCPTISILYRTLPTSILSSTYSIYHFLH